MREETFDVALELQKDHQFTVDFHQDGVPLLLVDEPPPLGQGRGPSASRLLAAAVGNCLGSSALFCLRKARIDVRGLRADVRATLSRNDQGRLRVTRLDVVLQVDVADQDRSRVGRCLEVFEDYCIVTQSVRQGLDVRVQVEPVTRTASATLGPRPGGGGSSHA